MDPQTLTLDDLVSYLRLTNRELARLDASETTHFARELLKVRAGVLEQKYPALLALSLIPRAQGVSPIDELYTWQVADEYGKTGTGTGYSQDVPRANVSMREATPLPIRPITLGYGFDFMEARQSAALGKGLPMRRAAACRRGILQQLDYVLSYGAPQSMYGAEMKGLLSLSSVNTYVTPVGAGGSKAWSSKTPQEILTDLYGIASASYVNTNGVLNATDLALPFSEFSRISQTAFGTGNTETILSVFKKNYPYPINVYPWERLAAAPAGGLASWTGKRAVAFMRDAEVIEAVVGVEFEQMAPETRGFETFTNAHARVGGVANPHPKGVTYGDEI